MAKFWWRQYIRRIRSTFRLKETGKRKPGNGILFYVFLFMVAFCLVTASIPGVATVSTGSLQANHRSTLSAQQTSTASLLERGHTLYEAGQFSEAVMTWQQAVEDFQGHGNQLNQALSLSYLSLAHQKLGEWQQAEEAIARSLELLEPRSNLEGMGIAILAQVLNSQGSNQLAMGQPEAALDSWEQAERIYAQAEDEAGVIGTQINQAQAFQTLGMYQRAQTLLKQVNARLQPQPDSMLKVLGLRSLGTVLQITGDLGKSREVLEQSLAIAQRLNPPLNTSEILFNLANTLGALQDTEAALRLYQQAADVAPTAIVRLKAQLNHLNLLIEMQQWTEAQALVSQIQPQFASLAPSRGVIYAEVNFASHLMKLLKEQREQGIGNGEQGRAIAQLLANAIQQARELRDPRAESYASGQLGGLYEQTQQWDDAQALTQQALLIAQTSNASDITYRWQWQLGRILNQKDNVIEARRAGRVSAIAAYTEAVKTLQSIRRDLLATNSEFQFSFRDGVEPLYRELVELLVQPDANSEDLKQAREVIEELQIAELENFFRSACLQPLQQIDSIDEKAAIIYPILLEHQIEVILSLPGQELRHYTAKVGLQRVESLLVDLHQKLILPYTSRDEINPLSHQVYNWIIQPVETAIAESGVKTLVFVLDGALRSIPMAALYDGEQYLVEKYNVALTPGLRLFEAKRSNQIELRALTAGLTEARHNFASLEFVELELAQIKSEIPTETLLNQEFTKATLADRVKSSPFPVVHIATHGQFSSQSNETFILAWDDPIRALEFDQLLQARGQNLSNTLELLVLSACETAEGDEHAVLGLAGVATRAGARSTLASLWLVDDESTASLMSEFYQGLKNGLTKAEALRHAQLTLLQGRYNHPRFWAAFVLLGNWL
jgi:CHAT domain-containing protein/tetratricopeptide (TPR) repeat protein